MRQLVAELEPGRPVVREESDDLLAPIEPGALPVDAARFDEEPVRLGELVAMR